MIVSNISESRQQLALWLDAGKTLAQDPSARVVCPSCGLGILQVRDEIVWNGERIERWMKCDNCGKANTLLLTPDQVANAPTSNATESSEAANAAEKNDRNAQFDWSDSDAVKQLVIDAVKSNKKKE